MNYVEDIQALRITIIDDTTKTELRTNKLLGQGLAGAKVSDQTLNDYQALIKQYLDKGYELVEPVELPTNYDNDPAKDQLVTLHLTHGTRTQAGASKVVTETITYVYGNGPKKGQTAAETVTKDYTFTSVDTIDAVTSAVLTTVWSDGQMTTPVTSPSITGYTPDIAEVSSQEITHDSASLTTVVTYTAGEQTVKVHYIDVYGTESDLTAGKELTAQMQTITGEAGANYTNTLWDHAAAGYELFQAQPEASAGTFDEDPDTEQNYYVYLTHRMEQVQGTPVTVGQTINYVYKTGPKAEQIASPSQQSSLTFVPTHTVDQVTKQNVGEPVWAPATDEFSAVTSPTITGYTADKAMIEALTVDPSSADSTVTVYYEANEQHLTYTVIDDTTGEVLVDKQLLASGDSTSVIPNAVTDKYRDIIEAYEAQGYVLVSSESLPANFDADDAVNQNVTLHLAHGTKQVAGKSKTVTQTINYLYGNGPKQGQTAAAQVHKDYSFTSVDTVDAVTGETLATVWSPAQLTDAVVSPVITGYIFDKATIASQEVMADSVGLEETVIYTAGEQLVKVHYVDVYGNETDLTTGKELTDHMQTLTGAAGSTYTNVLWNYEQAGYKLVQAQPEASAGNFDEDPEAEQNYYVYLTHATKQVAGPTKTVTQTVEYIYGNVPKQGQPVTQAVVQTYIFTATETLDAVTGEVLAIAWSPAQMTTAITSPRIAGYSADKEAMASQSITHTTPDQTLIVSYTADSQVVKVHYIDVYGDQERELLAQTQTLTGTTDESYDNVLWNYAQAGYELVKAQPEASAGVFDADRETDQHYYVYLTHKMQQVTGVPVIITDTINYIYGNGPKQGQPVSPAVVVTKTFVPLYTVDAVTGDIIETTWSGDGVIEASQVPEISGYTPDKTMIAERILTPTMENQSQTVYYMLDEKPAVDETPEPERPTETVDKEPGIGSDEKQEEQNEPPKQVTTTQTSSVDKEKTAPIKEGQTVTELPQTGDAATEKTTFVGAMLATLAGLLGFATTKRKKEDK
ncbi:LPXTG cell wall anchor domain-containing protein [Ligilactobacillus animalis]|uniref:mucin-binding protein n=3 Tax=Ligilactobacillus animalis TaxID=1605 RepID=UPI00290429B6|nr:MucBP domain-containing protein [Ligilactobacillus animalis]MDU1487513.1 LPXTG cell wall anchor domain-containing protein [Ligilactobacillus animalis]